MKTRRNSQDGVQDSPVVVFAVLAADAGGQHVRADLFVEGGKIGVESEIILLKLFVNFNNFVTYMMISATSFLRNCLIMLKIIMKTLGALTT